MDVRAFSRLCPLVMIATFHGDDPELATPVLEGVCNQATITEQPATTAQLPSYEVSSPDDRDVSAEDARAADSLGPMMSVIAASDSVSLQARQDADAQQRSVARGNCTARGEALTHRAEPSGFENR
jgi:hypothetical protein